VVRPPLLCCYWLWSYYHLGFSYATLRIQPTKIDSASDDNVQSRAIAITGLKKGDKTAMDGNKASLILIDPDKCTSCRQCEKVCSLKHGGECNPVLSSIKVLRREIVGESFVSVPVVCQQCETPMCKEVCPMEAIYQDLTTGAYLINEEQCIGCRLCTISCPLGAIEVNSNKRTAFKCDLCGGEPQCVKFCLPGALTYVEKDKVGFSARREALKKLSDRLVLVTSSSSESMTSC